MLQLPLPLAFLDIDFRQFMVLAIPVTAIVAGGTIAVCALYFQNRRREMWHQTARVALERGQPLPPQVDDERRGESFNPDRKDPRNDLRSGIILIGVGVGLYLFFSGLGARPIAQVGAIPGFIGVALVLYSLFSGSQGRGKTPDNRPPLA